MATGGVFTIKSKDLSAKTVMTTGNTLPAWSWVRALNCLQNCMMFTPLDPKAGPTGGEGFAAPPLICNLINPAMSLAITFFKKNYLLLFYLHKAKLQGCFTTENFNHNFKFLLLHIDFLNGSVETVKWSISHFYCLAYYEWGIKFFSAFLKLIHFSKDSINFGLTHGNRFAPFCVAQKTNNIGYISKHMGYFAHQCSFDQNVTGEKIAVFCNLFPIPDLIDLLHRD